MNDESAHTELRFPILDEEMLLSLPKSAKAQDMERIYTSPDSEDWVTWNILRALQRTKGTNWWAGIVAAAEADAGPSDRWAALDQPPSVDLWRTVETPPTYEDASRSRMSASDNDEWRNRADNPRPVEGRTEVDLVFEGDDYLIFVEAKLHSDISTGTTYDPDRNQIARNIDCLIDQAGSREAFFWMFVADRLPTRRYAALLERYRSNPEELHRLLPHRDPDLIDRIIGNIAMVTWSDLYPFLGTDGELTEIRAELERRTLDSSSGDVQLPEPATPQRTARRKLTFIQRLRRGVAQRLRRSADRRQSKIRARRQLGETDGKAEQ